MVDGWTVSPRKSRRKSPCFSSTVTSTPARASSRPRIIPAGPPPTTQQVVLDVVCSVTVTASSYRECPFTMVDLRRILRQGERMFTEARGRSGVPRLTDERREARRAEIVAAARRCFARDGFHQTSMPDIAREAGMSAGAFYRYFPSKEDVI